jgi:hypothetical protein
VQGLTQLGGCVAHPAPHALITKQLRPKQATNATDGRKDCRKCGQPSDVISERHPK